MGRKDAIESMRQILLKRRDALRKALAGDLSMLNELKDTAAGDLIDAALDSSYNELSSQLAEVESRELRHVEQALERIREGDYGLCERCSVKIPVARLNALPYSTLCIKCQREMETDANFWANRGAHSWDKVSDEGGMEDREVDLSDLEMDLSK